MMISKSVIFSPNVSGELQTHLLNFYWVFPEGHHRSPTQVWLRLIVPYSQARSEPITVIWVQATETRLVVQRQRSQALTAQQVA